MTLTSFTQRRQVRDDLNRMIRLYVEKCNCGARQPSVKDLHLDEHRPYCEFLIEVEKLNEEKVPERVDEEQTITIR